MNFRIGQRVVCVNNENGFVIKYLPCPLTLNAVYTVTDLYDRRYDIIKVDGDKEYWWHVSRFRPVTDISIFTKILEKEKEPA